MNPKAESIISLLNQVTLERRRREVVPGLHAAVLTVKRYQQRRFMHTYADLLTTKRFGAATRFFLDELYGPRDFSQRDAQFVRVVPTLVRLFPSEIVHTVDMLARLHAVSESLDTEMGSRVQTDPITRLSYKDAWQSTGRRADRDLQIGLTVEIGAALDRYTRQRVLRHTLKLMRGPAKAAGLGELQRFLESGFDTFREMNGAQDFLDMVITRERALAKALFEARGSAENVGSGNAPDAGSRYFDLLPPDEP
ncbi:MAG: hypothetical protein M9915_16630 [Rhizobacter sp.]|nr:hypothetical protein [Rhizobacter sp.]